MDRAGDGVQQVLSRGFLTSPHDLRQIYIANVMIEIDFATPNCSSEVSCRVLGSNGDVASSGFSVQGN